jgi:hydroxyacylglutathione hydrolase
VIVERSMHPGWLSNAYLVGDRPGGAAVFVDSGAPLEPPSRSRRW